MKKVKLTPRTIPYRPALRALAKYNMKKAGYKNMYDKKYIDPDTKEFVSGRSLFASRWRDFVTLEEK